MKALQTKPTCIVKLYKLLTLKTLKLTVVTFADSIDPDQTASKRAV